MTRTVRRALVGGSTMIVLALTSVAGGAVPSSPSAEVDRALTSRPPGSPTPSAPALPAPFDDVAASPGSGTDGAALDWSDARAAVVPLFLAATLGVILSLTSREGPTRLPRRGMRRST